MWQLDQFGMATMASRQLIDTGLTLKLKDPRGDPRVILRYVCSGSHAEQNETRIDRKCSAQVRLQLWRQGPLQIVDRWKTWSGECRAVYHRLASVVREGGDRWASRSSSQSSQAILAVVSSTVHRRSHREGARREAVKADPSPALRASFCESRVTDVHYETLRG
jgi:hypothetical protein